ncbi:hypothetical protein SAMN06272759_12228 [Novosphingobium sp. B1]|nr:hypothetical protein SAMN06272759_12228 [Novosphingobium sp. B1]
MNQIGFRKRSANAPLISANAYYDVLIKPGFPTANTLQGHFRKRPQTRPQTTANTPLYTTYISARPFGSAAPIMEMAKVRSVQLVRECWVCGAMVTVRRTLTELQEERENNIPSDIIVCKGCEQEEPANDRK